MKKFYSIALLILMACIGCQWQLSSHDNAEAHVELAVERFDRTEQLFLTTGDYAALQQLKTQYPVETRTLIEDVLQLGQVSDSGINSRFLEFFQDSTLQTILRDVDAEFSNMSDINRQFSESFERLRLIRPEIMTPRIYTQVGSLDQSIIVGDSIVGISLDKYLGSDYPLYLKYGYSEQQRRMMSRQFIVPDCIAFYLLSLYPDASRDSIEWLVNHAVYNKN